MTTPKQSNVSVTPTITVIDNQSQKRIDLPILSSEEGPDVIDVRSLYRDLDYFTYDPGFHLHCKLRLCHHFYRWRKRHFAAPWLFY